MPIARKWAYLDHAAVSPLPAGAQARMIGFADEAAESGTTIWPVWAKEVEQLRRGLAGWVGATSEEITLIPNTSFGINIVAEGFPWKSGDNVVIVEGDFPSNRFPWENQRAKGVEIRQVAPVGGRIVLDAIAELIDSHTRIVAVSWVGYASGYRLNLESLTQMVHDRGSLLFVDAIQGMGIYDIDVSSVPIDFMAADGHKWMLGPEGAGFAYLRKEHIDRLRCTNVGWHSVVNSYDFKHAEFELRPDAARFESGSMNMVGLATMAKSLELFWQIDEHHGNHAISNRVLELAAMAIEKLKSAGARVLYEHPDENSSSIIVFDVPGVAPARVRSIALANNVVTSCRGGGTRISIHAYNDASDIDRLVTVVREAAAQSANEYRNELN